MRPFIMFPNWPHSFCYFIENIQCYIFLMKFFVCKFTLKIRIYQGAKMID